MTGKSLRINFLITDIGRWRGRRRLLKKKILRKKRFLLLQQSQRLLEPRSASSARRGGSRRTRAAQQHGGRSPSGSATQTRGDADLSPARPRPRTHQAAQAAAEHRGSARPRRPHRRIARLAAAPRLSRRPRTMPAAGRRRPAGSRGTAPGAAGRSPRRGSVGGHFPRASAPRVCPRGGPAAPGAAWEL